VEPIYTFVSFFTEGAVVKSHIGKASLGLVLVMLTVMSNACLVAPQTEGNTSSIINGLEAEYINVYPRGTSQIKCVASSLDNSAVKFTWSCTGGSIIGEGSAVTWEAPSDYGDYHIMVMAKDKNGIGGKATLTISVVPRPSSGCCGR
jgi:hypothetical protein